MNLNCHLASYSKVFSFFFCLRFTVASGTTAPAASAFAFFASKCGSVQRARAAGHTVKAPLHRTGGLLIDGELIGLELDALLVVVTRKAQDDLAAALYALEGTGLREGELHRLVAQLEIRLLYQVLFHEQGEGVTLRPLGGLQPPILEINDVRSQIVQEGRGMRGAHNAAREGFKPVLKPPVVFLRPKGSSGMNTSQLINCVAHSLVHTCTCERLTL